MGVSAGREAEELQAGATDEYRAVFNAAPDGILVVDAEGRIRELNARIEALFQYERSELVGREVELLVPERFRQGHGAHREHFGASPHRRPMGIGLQLTGRRKDGSEFPVEISLSPVKRGSGSPVIAIVRDQTEWVRLRRFGTRALRAAEDERRRLARELHDDTAQRLATILLRIRMLADRSDETQRIGLEAIQEEIRETMEGVRQIARGLRPPALEDAGIVPAIKAHLRGVANATGVEARFESGGSSSELNRRLGPEERLVLYRVIQEAVSNAVRHSGSDRVDVRLRVDPEGLDAVVEDRGEGFDVGLVRGRAEGLGLVGMEERVTSIGGRIEIDSGVDRGTRVTVKIPIRPDEGEERGE